MSCASKVNGLNLAQVAYLSSFSMTCASKVNGLNLAQVANLRQQGEK